MAGSAGGPGTLLVRVGFGAKTGDALLVGFLGAGGEPGWNMTLEFPVEAGRDVMPEPELLVKLSHRHGLVLLSLQPQAAFGCH